VPHGFLIDSEKNRVKWRKFTVLAVSPASKNGTRAKANPRWGLEAGNSDHILVMVPFHWGDVPLRSKFTVS